MSADFFPLYPLSFAQEISEGGSVQGRTGKALVDGFTFEVDQLDRIQWSAFSSEHGLEVFSESYRSVLEQTLEIESGGSLKVSVEAEGGSCLVVLKYPDSSTDSVEMVFTGRQAQEHQFVLGAFASVEITAQMKATDNTALLMFWEALIMLDR